MNSKLEIKGKPKTSTVLGMTALAFVGSGFFANTAEASTTHTVQEGDVLETIGRQYNVSVAQLRRWNNLQTDIIQIGQRLIVAEPNNSGATNTQTPTATGNRPMTVTANGLNVRSGAGTSHGIIGSLSRNQVVTVTGTVNGWHTIQFNGRIGFVHRDFMREGGTVTNVVPSGTRVVVANGLNVRSGAGTNHSVIGGLTRNQAVTVTGSTNGWYQINFNGRVGFIHSDFVNVQTGGNTNSAQVSGTRTINTDGLNIRSGAGTNHGVIGSLTRNQVVTVTGNTNGWYQINFNGRTGFISSNFVVMGGNAPTNTPPLTNNNTPPPANTTTSASGARMVTSSGLNIRSGAGTSHGVIGSLSRNQVVNVTGNTNGWYHISHNGRAGFINASFVTTQVTNNGNTVNGGNVNNNAPTSVNVSAMISFAQQFIGVPYLWGGQTPTGFDCSGFVHFVFRNNGINIPRTNVVGYWNNNNLFTPITSPQAGDIIFFQNTYTSGPSHMGIMVNSTQFIHASLSRGIVTTDVSNSFWSQHFLGFRRIR